MSLNSTIKTTSHAVVSIWTAYQKYSPRYWEAFTEVVVVVFFGIFPFVLAVLQFNFNNSNATNIEWASVAVSSFEGGQLYLYAFSLFGTLAWLAFFNWTVPYYKHRLLIAFIVIVVGFIIAALGGLDPSFSKIKNTSLVAFSYYFYALFIFLYFALLVISKGKPPALRDTLKTETGKLMHKYENIEQKNG